MVRRFNYPSRNIEEAENNIIYMKEVLGNFKDIETFKKFESYLCLTATLIIKDYLRFKEGDSLLNLLKELKMIPSNTSLEGVLEKIKVDILKEMEDLLKN